jgi:hypothetical protein
MASLKEWLVDVEETKYTHKSHPNANLSTTDPHLGLNLGRHSGKPATSRLSYDTAIPECMSEMIC